MKNRETAQRLHHLAIALTRRVREADKAAPIGSALLSALSVLVFGGRKTLSELADIEQVSRPTMTVNIQKLEKLGYIIRAKSEVDSRSTIIEATEEGRFVMFKARDARLAILNEAFDGLSPKEVQAIELALPAITKLTQD
jgi:DNA-binding MarR family transcriptional regulator